MLNANENEVNKIISESILSGIHIADNELKINDFNFKAFRYDLTSLFNNEGWI